MEKKRPKAKTSGRPADLKVAFAFAIRRHKKDYKRYHVIPARKQNTKRPNIIERGIHAMRKTGNTHAIIIK